MPCYTRVSIEIKDRAVAEMRDWASKFAQHASRKKEISGKDGRKLAL